MFLWDGVQAHLSSNSFRVVGKLIHNLIFHLLKLYKHIFYNWFRWFNSFTYFSKIVSFFLLLLILDFFVSWHTPERIRTVNFAHGHILLQTHIFYRYTSITVFTDKYFSLNLHKNPLSRNDPVVKLAVVLK